MANEIKVYTGVKIAGVGVTTDGRMKVDIGGANINATISDITLKDVGVTADNRLKVDSSSTIEEFIFADAVTAAGSKQYTILDRKFITITLDKDQDATDATFSFWFVSGGKKHATQGLRVTGEYDLVSSGKPGEIITIEKPAGVTFELQWTLPVGGNVTAKATVS